MRLAFVSDIHGNAIALDAILQDITEQNIDKVYILGDICFRGPEPKRSLELIRSLDADVIKGNADEWIVRGIKDGEVPQAAIDVMNEERNWTVSKLLDESITYLKHLPTELNLEFESIKIHAFHATPHSLFEGVQPDERDEVLTKKLIVKDADIFIYAHIHKPFVRYIDGKCIINTGSVGLPFDGNNKSSYVIVEVNETQFTTSLVRVGYDVNKVIQQFTNSDYPNRKLLIQLLENAQL